VKTAEMKGGNQVECIDQQGKIVRNIHGLTGYSVDRYKEVSEMPEATMRKTMHKKVNE